MRTGIRGALVRLRGAIAKHSRAAKKRPKAAAVANRAADLRAQLATAKREIGRLETMLASCGCAGKPSAAPERGEPRWVVYDKSEGEPKIVHRSWAKTERQAFKEWARANPEHDGDGIRSLSWKRWKAGT